MTDQPLRVDAEELSINPATLQTLYQGQPFTGEMYEYYKDGTVMAMSEYVNGVPHGCNQAFYRDGRQQAEGHFRYNRRVGVHRTWYQNGQIEEEITYADDGSWVSTRRWNENGALIYTDTPDDGPSSLHR